MLFVKNCPVATIMNESNTKTPKPPNLVTLNDFKTCAQLRVIFLQISHGQFIPVLL